ncbi:hypothetical protein [uncultured Friedmanniella sp.]|uniref:hypothetical protein n=1 Tax=uncultured Friedmanniella sp. TaxID=335381 RepID=UPI0035C990EC
MGTSPKIIGYRKNGSPIRAILGASLTLDRLRQERQACIEFVERTLGEVETRGGDLSSTENESLGRQKSRIAELDAQIKPLQEFEDLRAADQRGADSYRPTAPAGGQGGTATPAGARTEQRKHEYRTRGEIIVDIISQERGTFSADGTKITVTDQMRDAARERLQGAGVIYPGAPEDYVARAVSNETTSNIPGLLPKPIIGQVDSDIDASRPFVSSIGAKDMAGIAGKTFTRPIITQHTQVAKQTAEKTELTSRQLVVGGVDFTKETHGGVIDVARQVMDWSSPSAWDALLADLQDEYAIDTETAAATAFAAAVTATVPNAATEDPKGWAAPLYAAAALAYAGSGRLPNAIWCSLDQWQRMGVAVDAQKLMLRSDDRVGTSSPTSFEGVVMDLPRIVVPSFPAKTVIIGVKEKTEFYEQKIGFLTAVEPRLLGVELAYGGYCAFGTLRAGAFAKLLIP